MKATRTIPDDPGLPGLVSIRALGLDRAIPELELGEGPIDLRVLGYSRGSRATLEARAGDRHLVIKCYSGDPAAEADLYEFLAAAGLASHGSTLRVPRLLACRSPLRMLAISWLAGPTIRDRIAEGQGDRAGELAARWIRSAASLPVKAISAVGAAEVLARTRHWSAELGAADDSLGSAAAVLSRSLSDTLRAEPALHLVHGRFYLRHVFDLGGAAGVIDWDHAGLGPLELDAGMFLATLWRTGQHAALAREAVRADQAFATGTAGLLDAHRLAWYRAAALMCLAYHLLGRRENGWLGRASGLLNEANRGLAERASARSSALRPRTPVPRRAEPVPARAGSAPHLAVMRALWAGGEIAADELARSLEPAPRAGELGASMEYLEREGLVTRRSVDGRILYRAAVDQEDIRRTVTADFVSFADELFEGDMAAVVCQLVRVRDLKANDVARVIALLQAREREMERELP